MKLKEMKEKYKAIIFGTLVVVGVLGLAFLGDFIIGEPVPKSTVENVQISIQGEDWSMDCTMESTTNNTVFGLLKECSEMHGFAVGSTVWEPYDAVFVDSINGLDNGGEKWWQYYVNGEYGDVASDRKRIVDGDLVEWKYELPRIG
jgi:hypothetical protein